jgi:hypothetical protein
MTVKTPLRFLAVCLGVYVIIDALLTCVLGEDLVCRSALLGAYGPGRKIQFLLGLALIAGAVRSSLKERARRSSPLSFSPGEDVASAPASKPDEEP